MSASIRRLRTVSAVTAAAVLAALTLSAAPADAGVADPPTASISWSFPDGEVLGVASSASVTVDGTWQMDPAQTDPYAYLLLYVDVLVDGRLTDETTLTPGHTSESLSLDTRDMGTHEVKVVVTNDYKDVAATDVRQITVSGAPTTVTAVWPTVTKVKIGAKSSVTGIVDGGTGRAVLLQHKTGSGWQTLVSTITGGPFEMPIPATWYGKRTLRIEVPQADGYLGAIAPQGKTLVVSPAYKPKGKTTATKVTRSRFDACETVTWRFNPKKAPTGALPDLKKAFAAYSQATGLSFRYLGKTTVIPFKGNGPRHPLAHATFRGFDIAVGWATPKQVPSLAGKTLGLGGATTFTGARDARGFAEIGTSEVVFDASQKTKHGWGKGLTRGEVLLHQIGGALGLAGLPAAKGTGQVMGTKPLAVDRFGAGDIAGLAKVGLSAGCFSGNNG